MAWSSLASNQMVSFTDAQGGGFTLQSGQSPVTSNQCMTKNDALTKYVLNSSYMASYASNQLVPKSTWVAGIVSYNFPFNSTQNNTGLLACLIGSYNTNVYCADATITSSSIIYSDSGLTTLYNGLSKYYYINNNGTPSFIRISTTGTVTNLGAC